MLNFKNAMANTHTIVTSRQDIIDLNNKIRKNK